MRLIALLLGVGTAAASMCGAAALEETFSADPAANGWKTFGDASLFQWNPTNQNLQVTWDSARTNSYLYRPLGTILNSNDAFSLEFDLQLDDANITGFGFQIAVGLFHLANATATNFFRGAGHDSPNLFEFDYFPDFGFGSSIDATLIDRNSRFRFAYDNLPLEPGYTYHVALHHAANTLFLTGEVLRDGQPYTSLPSTYFQPPLTNFSDFRLDAVSISSFNHGGSGGSILAHGIVDNFVVTLPPPPIQNFTGAFSNNVWQARFLSRSNWLYTLERSADFQSWTNAAPATPGNGTNLFLTDMNPPVDPAFYRIRANRP